MYLVSYLLSSVLCLQIIDCKSVYVQAMGPIQVRYADGERERHGNAVIFSSLPINDLCALHVILALRQP